MLSKTYLYFLTLILIIITGCFKSTYHYKNPISTMPDLNISSAPVITSTKYNLKNQYFNLHYLNIDTTELAHIDSLIIRLTEIYDTTFFSNIKTTDQKNIINIIEEILYFTQQILPAKIILAEQLKLDKKVKETYFQIAEYRGYLILCYMVLFKNDKITNKFTKYTYISLLEDAYYCLKYLDKSIPVNKNLKNRLDYIKLIIINGIKKPNKTIINQI